MNNAHYRLFRERSRSFSRLRWGSAFPTNTWFMLARQLSGKTGLLCAATMTQTANHVTGHSKPVYGLRAKYPSTAQQFIHRTRMLVKAGAMGF